MCIRDSINGAKQCRNFSLLAEGGVMRRPGTTYLASLPGESRLIPFVFSDDEIAIIALSNNRMDVYNISGTALSSNVTTNCNWSTAQLFELNFAQFGDTIFVAHRDNPIRKIFRSSATNFEVQEFAILGKKHGLTYSILVPAMYALLLHRNALIAEDLQSWRIGAFGGAPMPDAVRKKLASKLPFLSLNNAYGATETTSPTTIIRIHCDDPGDSVGLVVQCGEVRIVDDNNKEVNQGETGELWIKGPMVVPGYWNNEQASESSFESGYWKSGDIASKDENGFIRIHDRKKDMINRGGYKIFSAEIENLMMLMDEVQEAALVPYPCPILGERSHAFIFSSSNVIDPNKIRRELLGKVADYKVPDKITITQEPLPRNVNGKITKAPLRDVAQKSI